MDVTGGEGLERKNLRLQYYHKTFFLFLDQRGPVTTLELRPMPLVTCPPEKLLSELSLQEGPEKTE